MTNTVADRTRLCSKCGAGPARLTWGHCPTCWRAVVAKRGRRMAEGPTALYRLYNEFDDLLYIGTTVDLKVRFKDHRSRMPWWYQVDQDRTVVEWLDCGHGRAVHVENTAIRAELPWYNRTGYDENGQNAWPNLPPGCPPQPWYTHRPATEYRLVWHGWFAIFRDCMLNPGERAALGRLPGRNQSSS